MFKNSLFQIHWFIGITAGSVLAVVGSTGGMLAFEQEILRLINVKAMTIAPVGSALPPADLIDRIAAQSPGKRVTALTLSSRPREPARVTFAGESPERRNENRYVNPYTGEILPKPAGEQFFRTVTQVHRYLASGDVGKHVVGASTFGLVIIALSGLYLRWPRKTFHWRDWLVLGWVQKGRAFLWSLHSVLGTWVLLCYLLAALTGLYWSYAWYRNALFYLTGAPRFVSTSGAGAPERSRAVNTSAARPGDEQARDMNRAWQLFGQEVGSYGSATLRLPAKAGQPMQISYLDLAPRHSRATNRIVFDVAAGKIVEHERYRDKPLGSKIMNSMLPLHSGRFFGWPGAVLMMLASLVLPVSSVSGWLLYLDRRRKKKQRLTPGAAPMARSSGS